MFLHLLLQLCAVSSQIIPNCYSYTFVYPSTIDETNVLQYNKLVKILGITHKDGHYMKVLLLQDVKGQGKKGDIINVSDGYANNFLLKRGLGKVATADTINSAEIHKQAVAKQKEAEKQKAIEDANKLKGVTVRIVADKGVQGGKMYGSITNKEIAEELNKMGYTIDKKQIVLKEPIRVTGLYTVTVKMYAEIAVQINVSVE